MAIRVEIPASLRSYTGGQRWVPAAGANLAELFADLGARHPGLCARLLTQDGTLRRFINVYINDDDIRFRQWLDSSLTDSDVVSIISAVAGG